MLFLKCILSPVRSSVPYGIFSKHLLFSTSNLSNATTAKPRTEENEDYRQRRQIAMTHFWLNECGFSESQLSDIACKLAELFRTKSTDRAYQAIQFFRDSGFTGNQVRNILFVLPTVLRLKVDTQLKPKFEFMKKLGFTSSDLGRLLSRAPRLLSSNLERNLRPKILVLVSLFGSKLNLCKALMSQPSILLCKVEILKPRIDILKLYGIQDELFLYVMNARPGLLFYNSEEALKSKIECVRNLGILERSKAFAHVLATVDSSGLEKFENKIKHMATLGLLENEIIQILKRVPRLLSSSIDKTGKNMEFLKHIAGIQPNIVVKYPRLLLYSIKNRLQPRHTVIDFLRQTEPSRLPTNIAYLYDMGEQSFARKFLMGSPQVAKLFENCKVKSVDASISLTGS